MLRSKGVKIFNIFNVVFLLVAALTCLLPFVHILAISFSSQAAVSAGIVRFWPVMPTTYAYEYLLRKQMFWMSFGNSIKRVILGGTVNMVLIILSAYPLSKEKDQFRARGVYVWYFFFTMLFSGGLIPSYMLLYQMNLLDSIWALVLPGAVPVFNLILMLNFYRQIPREMEEAALIDGAGYFRVLFEIYLPCSLPALATITLFTVVGHWNAWFDGLIYMNNTDNYPLQSYIQTVIIGLDMSASTVNTSDYERLKELSDRTLKTAQIIIATIPILCVYPFLQKYFVSGIVLGSVKG